MNSHITRRPNIGLLAIGRRTFAAIEEVSEDGRVVGYVDQISAKDRWLPSEIDSFAPLAEIPEPRMDEPQETWATVVTKECQGWSPRVYYRRPDGKWERLGASGCPTYSALPWSDLINPRPTTPTERATGIVGGEDQ